MDSVQTSAAWPAPGFRAAQIVPHCGDCILQGSEQLTLAQQLQANTSLPIHNIGLSAPLHSCTSSSRLWGKVPSM